MLKTALVRHNWRVLDWGQEILMEKSPFAFIYPNIPRNDHFWLPSKGKKGYYEASQADAEDLFKGSDYLQLALRAACLPRSQAISVLRNV